MTGFTDEKGEIGLGIREIADFTDGRSGVSWQKHLMTHF
jgi:hypothetical protein